MAVKVKFIRRNTQEIENLPVADGQLLYDYQSGSIYMDYGNTRVTLSPNIITSVNGKTGEVTIDLNNLNAEEKGVAQALLTTHLDSYDHTKLNIIKTNGSNEKFLNQEGNYVEVSAIGSTRWENDGIDKIKPKNEKKVSVDNIDKAMSKEVYDELEVEEQLVGVTATQTLSNKTLVAPLIKNHAQYFLTDTDFGKKELIEEDDNDGARFVTEITDDNWDNKKTAISIDTSGKIGIGKKNPEYKLDVDGDVNIPAGSNYKIDGVDIGTGGGGLEWIEKDENYTIKSGEGVLADTSADTWTLTLPASPTAGDFIGVSDSASSFDTENLIIARNGSKIMGEEEDLVVDLKDASFQLIYTGDKTGWKIDTNLGTNLIKYATGEDIDEGSDNTKLVTSKAINDSYIYQMYNGMGRQAIINGNFDIWQRGTSFSLLHSGGANDVYTADRWKAYCGEVLGKATISRQLFTLGQTDVPNNPKYFLRFDQTANGSNYNPVLYQKIEGVSIFAGQKVTLSFWVKSAGTIAFQPLVIQTFGTGGSPSATVTTYGESVTTSTSWQKIARTFAIPSISGKTLGSNNNDNLRLGFFFPKDATFTVDIAQVQLCAGDVALPFMPKSFDEELRACQRYFQKIGGTIAYERMTLINMGCSTTEAICGILIPKMRITPAMTINGSRGTDWTLWSVANKLNTTGTFSTNSFASSNIASFTFSSGTFTAGTSHYLSFDSTSGYLLASAEL